ncbi:hypothetical protein H5410_005042 [Solanum commersonii]|uniref:Reverse transcriptase zinc-binding domain-containing protein n=1 Tax=Solanum commersonii TaxID=4109 RepID=A0A9J6A624_SOLCO|nr:hypothetical protein H5410_005042 [Solanum commersonii]
MPKKVIKSIESICKKFLWSGGADTSRKALIAWETLCLPKVVGGLNFLDITTWNNVANILKAKNYYKEAGWNKEEILRSLIFSVKKIYIRMKEEFPKLEWRRLICNNAAPPSSGMDTSEHLFFACGYSITLWRKILQWMHIDRQILGWKEEIPWALRRFKGKHALAGIF